MCQHFTASCADHAKIFPPHAVPTSLILCTSTTMAIHIFLLASFFLFIVPFVLLSTLGGTKCKSLLLGTSASVVGTLSRLVTPIIFVICCFLLFFVLIRRKIFMIPFTTDTRPSLAPGIGFDLSTSYGYVDCACRKIDRS